MIHKYWNYRLKTHVDATIALLSTSLTQISLFKISPLLTNINVIY